MSYSLMLGLVMLGSFLQEGSGTTAVRGEFCQPFKIVKKFNLRDAVTKQSCTLKIRAVICRGFCRSLFVTTGKLVRTFTDVYYDCNCCRALHKPRLRVVPPMALTCLEGQKWNYAVKLPVIRDCTCQTCNPSSILTG